MIAYLLFSITYILEVIAGHFFPPLYMGGVLVLGRTLPVVIAIVYLIKLVKAQLYTTYIFRITLLFLSLLVLISSVNGLYRDNNIHAFLSHLVSYLSFLILLFCCSQMYMLKADKILDFIGKVSPYILLVVLMLTYFIFTMEEQSPRLSLSFTLLCIPVSYYLSSRIIQIWFILSVVLILMTLKRSIWLAFLVQCVIAWRSGLLKGWGASLIFYLKSLVISKNKKSMMHIIIINILILLFLVFSFTGTDSINKLWGYFWVKLDFENIRAVNLIDAITSGRVLDYYAVLHALGEGNAFLFGLGFGVVYDGMATGEALHGYSGEWLKSGSDVIFLNMWLLHGVILGSILFIVLLVFLIRSYFFMLETDDRWFRFLFLIFIFYFIESLFSFVPWDPLWAIILGLLIARKKWISDCANSVMKLE